MTRAWHAWVDLWDRREDAAALALVRIFVGLVLVVDYLDLARLGLVDAVYSPVGFGAAFDGWLSPHSTWLVALVASLCILTGTLTRVACVAFVLASVQLADMSPNAERGIDTILRIVAGILAFSQGHARWSVDAFVRRKLGRPLAYEVPAWPRYLLLLQLVWIYFSGGLNKGGAPWFPHGGFTALANILADPHVARFDPGLVPMALTRIATVLTMLFEFGAPLYLAFYYFAATRERPGRLRALCNRLRLRWAWIALGIGFHLGIAIGMRLGIFPWGMLALYPVLLLPGELRR
jgi:uncharacterized membrane protein YphA (DoxX/SURF4 family)